MSEWLSIANDVSSDKKPKLSAEHGAILITEIKVALVSLVWTGLDDLRHTIRDTRYFPGWTATVDGAPVSIEPYGEQGLIALHVPAGVHTVTTRWGTTMPRVVGALLSFTALVLAIVWLWRARSRRLASRTGE